MHSSRNLFYEQKGAHVIQSHWQVLIMYNFNLTAGVTTGNNKFPCAHVVGGGNPGIVVPVVEQVAGPQASNMDQWCSSSTCRACRCRSLRGVEHRALRNRPSSLQHRQQKPCKAHVDALLSVVRRPPTCALSPQRKNFPSSSQVQTKQLNHAGIYIMNHLLHVLLYSRTLRPNGTPPTETTLGLLLQRLSYHCHAGHSGMSGGN